MTTPNAPSPKMFMITAVEPSADILGASLMAALRKKFGAETRFIGCGGPLMERCGCRSLFPIEPFSVIGPMGAIKAIPAALSGADKLAREGLKHDIAAAIFIDSWSFSRLAAARLKKVAPDIARIKFAAPQFWASRPKRLETLSTLFDGVLTLFEFEEEPIEAAGGAAKFVGNPIYQAAANAPGDGDRFRARHHIGASRVLAILPGSRKGEVKRLLPIFRLAVERLARQIDDLKIVIPYAPAVEALVKAQASGWPVSVIFAAPDEKYDAIAAADAALAASGTVTTEIAINATPLAIAYIVDDMTAWWAKKVITTPYVSLINVAAAREVVPEYIQEDCEASIIADAILPLITDAGARAAQLEAFPGALAKLGVYGAPAAKQAAEAISEWIDRK